MTSKRRERTAKQAYTNGHGVAAFFAPEADTSDLAPTAGVAGIYRCFWLLLSASELQKVSDLFFELCLSVIKSKRISVNEKARRSTQGLVTPNYFVYRVATRVWLLELSFACSSRTLFSVFEAGTAACISD